MSVKLMSAIFETEFIDLKDEAGNVTKASTAKFVLLALADHANDDGQGAYPSLTRMELKTGLSRPTLINTYDALKFHGFITRVGTSKLKTSNYSITKHAFPRRCEDGKTYLPVKPLDKDDKATLPPPVKPLDQASKATLPSLVKPLDINHPSTTIKPSREIDSTDVQKVWDDLEILCGAVPPDTARLIDLWIGKHLLERIRQAIGIARVRGARSPRYVDQVLITWEANGYPPTREQQVLARAFKLAKGQNGTDKPHYKIPEYSEADLAIAAEINRMSALRRAKLAEARPASGTS